MKAPRCVDCGTCLRWSTTIEDEPRCHGCWHMHWLRRMAVVYGLSALLPAQRRALLDSGFTVSDA